MGRDEHSARTEQPPHTIADVGAINAGRDGGGGTAPLRPGISPFVNQHSSNGRNTAQGEHGKSHRMFSDKLNTMAKD